MSLLAAIEACKGFGDLSVPKDKRPTLKDWNRAKAALGPNLPAGHLLPRHA